VRVSESESEGLCGTTNSPLCVASRMLYCAYAGVQHEIGMLDVSGAIETLRGGICIDGGQPKISVANGTVAARLGTHNRPAEVFVLSCLLHSAVWEAKSTLFATPVGLWHRSQLLRLSACRSSLNLWSCGTRAKSSCSSTRGPGKYWCK
jgi:hypothetical protein